MTRRGKNILWIAGGLGVPLLAAGIVLFALAAADPEIYQPVRLDPAQRAEAAKTFYETVMAFSNGAQGAHPFRWSVSQRELNEFLASLDEINAFRPPRRGGGDRRGELARAMREAGLSDPAVELDDGAMSLMVRGPAGMVATVRVAFERDEPGELYVRVLEKRLGRLPLPEGFLTERMERLQHRLDRKLTAEGQEVSARPAPGDTAAAVGMALARVASAAGREPLPTEVVWPFNDKPLRIDDVILRDDSLTLHVTPLNSAGRAR